MAININNGVLNILNTPGIFAAEFANAPNAVDVAEGTLWIDITNNNLNRATNGVWLIIGGGGGGTSDLNQVLATGNIGNNGIDLIIDDTTGSATYRILSQPADYGGFLSYENSTGKYMAMSTNVVGGSDNLTTGNYKPGEINYTDAVSNKKVYIKPKNFNDQTLNWTEDTGTLAIQSPPLIATITGNYSPVVSKECLYIVAVGANPDITLNVNDWIENVRVGFLCQDKCNFVAGTGSPDIFGQPNIAVAGGLVYCMYNNNSFYLSHM